MKRFCLECGAEAQSSDLICTECGTPLERAQEKSGETVTNKQAPMSKKKKVLVGSVLFFIAILVGLYTFGNTYTSAESTLKRFHEAVLEKDKDALKKLVEFEGGKKLSDGELDGIIAFGAEEPNEFTKSIGEWSFGQDNHLLFALKQSGKVFGVFDDYTFIVPNQHISVPFQYEELEYTLNGEKLKMTVEEGRAIIGPIAPGIYELTTEYSGEYVEFSQSKQVELLEPYGDTVYEDIDFDVSEVTFEFDHSSGDDPSKTKLVIGDKEIAFDKEGYIGSVGPLLLDGSVKMKTITTFPWGEIESEELGIEESYISVVVNGVNEEIEKDIADAVLAYGEQYVAARWAASTKDMAGATSEWKKVMQESFNKERENGYFSGQLDEVQANFESARVVNEENKFRIVVPVSFALQTVVSQDGGNPELNDELQSCSIEVVYVDDEWKIDRCQGGWYMNEAGGTVLEGSKKLLKATGVKETKEEDSTSNEESASKESEVDELDLEYFMVEYNDWSVIAINTNDYSQVSNLIVPGSPREKEQSDYIGYLNSKDITEEHLGTTLESYKSIDDTTVEVTTKETFNIQYPDKDHAENTYTTVSQLKLVDGEWLMYKLISTK